MKSQNKQTTARDKETGTSGTAVKRHKAVIAADAKLMNRRDSCTLGNPSNDFFMRTLPSNKG